MSGIAGMMHRDGRPVSPDAISAMSTASAHRGSDAKGMICTGAIGMAHRMLWSTPESRHERQPLVREAAALCLVADARIDNRDDLTTQLVLGRNDRTSDADIIIAAYERWGSACVDHLIGDFAFAIWDGRRRQLFCARDPMGVKPFCYVQSERLFAFASEAKALLTLPEVPGDIDPIRIALFVEGTVDDRSHTPYKAIRRLPAAHTLTVSADRSSQHRYWRPDVTRELKLSNSSEYAEAFREIFEKAVQARLRSAYPLGAALSGGLDSSSIVCMARHVQRAASSEPLHTFSLVFPSFAGRDLRLIDERQYIDSVVRDGGVTPTYVRGDELSPVTEIDDALQDLEEPYAAPNLYLHRALYRAMHERGARVFLDGFDGDSAVSHGFGRMNVFVRSGQWDAFESEVRALAANRRVPPEAILAHLGLPYLELLARQGKWLGWARAARELTRRFDLSARSAFLNHGLRPAVPDAVRMAYRALRRQHPEARSLVQPVMARMLRERAPALGAETDIDILSSERESHVQGLSQPAYQLTLEMADKCAAALGVEPRYPFFDRRLIDFCIALPESEKLAGGWPRLVFRRAMDGILPNDIRWRSDKGNLSPNFHRILRASPETALDAAPDSTLGEHVNLRALREMRRRYCEETSTLGRSADGHTLFRVMVLQRWLAKRARATDPVACAAPTAPVAA